MYLFVDTEFTDFIDCDLISLGIVSEDGQHEFYVEITDHNVEWQSEFVRVAIVPMLENEKYGKPFDEAAKALKEWIDNLPGEYVLVIADYGMDLQLLSELLHDNAPRKKVQGHLLEKAYRNALHGRGFHLPHQHHIAWRAMINGIEDYFADVDNRRHHALVDAKANRYGWVKGFEDAARA